MHNSTFITQILDNATLVKIASCADEGGPTDIVPAVFYSNGKEQKMLVMDMDEFQDVIHFLVIALTYFGAEYGPFVHVGIVSDSFARNFEEGEDPESYLENTTLADRFAESPASGVQEALICSVISADGSQEAGMTAYRYGDDGMPEFEPIELLGSSQGGRIHDILATFHKATQTFFQKG